MGFSFGVSKWSGFDEDLLELVKEHAAIYADEPVDWESWLANEIEGGKHYGYAWGSDTGGILEDVIRPYAFKSEPGKPVAPLTIFVPYYFNQDLCPHFPPPHEFWRTSLSENVMLVSGSRTYGYWECWYGSDKKYMREAKRHAARFEQEIQGEEVQYNTAYYFSL
jgi:hypothetical protein